MRRGKVADPAGAAVRHDYAAQLEALLQTVATAPRCPRCDRIGDGLCLSCQAEDSRASEVLSRMAFAESHPADALAGVGVDRTVAECVARGVGDPKTIAAVNEIDLADGAYFWGRQAGNGKTLALAYLALRHLRAGDVPVWAKTHQILRRIRDSFDDRFVSERGIFGKYVTARVLMLDDVAVAGTDHERRVLYELLEDRDPYRQVTCATGNCSLAELAGRVDQRVSSRLSERARPVEITDTHDYRADRWRKRE